ncbi:hypothetical protein [Bacillus thuringiensis]|uniref:hypothetical protein n=1 Tax=Bacillus thuringiensis TaxID=1428 RepID=UPI0011A457EF|nr:hypothetical protein [Bacillus thuringiensis]
MELEEEWSHGFVWMGEFGGVVRVVLFGILGGVGWVCDSVDWGWYRELMGLFWGGEGVGVWVVYKWVLYV